MVNRRRLARATLKRSLAGCLVGADPGLARALRGEEPPVMSVTSFPLLVPAHRFSLIYLLSSWEAV
jgi:hypothetical protein